jgi:hypothetical protein
LHRRCAPTATPTRSSAPRGPPPSTAPGIASRFRPPLPLAPGATRTCNWTSCVAPSLDLMCAAPPPLRCALGAWALACALSMSVSLCVVRPAGHRALLSLLFYCVCVCCHAVQLICLRHTTRSVLRFGVQMYVTGCVAGNCTVNQVFPSSLASDTFSTAYGSAALHLLRESCFTNDTTATCHFFVGVFVRAPRVCCRSSAGVRRWLV